MAGVKGKSGRTAGSARQSAKLKIDLPPAIPAAIASETPLQFMLRVMNDPEQSVAIRAKLAVTAAQYMHLKKGDGGIKDERKAAAGKVLAGKFGAAAPPKLVANNR